MVDHESELAGVGHPHGTQLRTGSRIQARASRHQLCVRQALCHTQACTRVNSARIRNQKRPTTGGVAALGTQPQGGMAVQERLQDDDDIILGYPDRSLEHDCLVELVYGARHTLQPMNDRSGQHRADSVIDDSGPAVREAGHRRHCAHGLLDEDIAWPAVHTCRPSTRHHLHRQDAVAAEIEERLVHAHSIDSEDLSVDIGQDLLDRPGRRAVISSDTAVFGSGQGAFVQLAVDG
ncbi:Uncharacterised protein [Mycobacteroides abscessus subsp. bolletii]|nr:Uncharacterised protein [Mycobacteroides abscessus subsp. bolletii]